MPSKGKFIVKPLSRRSKSDGKILSFKIFLYIKHFYGGGIHLLISKFVLKMRISTYKIVEGHFSQFSRKGVVSLFPFNFLLFFLLFPELSEWIGRGCKEWVCSLCAPEEFAMCFDIQIFNIVCECPSEDPSSHVRRRGSAQISAREWDRIVRPRWFDQREGAAAMARNAQVFSSYSAFLFEPSPACPMLYTWKCLVVLVFGPC